MRRRFFAAALGVVLVLAASVMLIRSSTTASPPTTLKPPASGAVVPDVPRAASSPPSLAGAPLPPSALDKLPDPRRREPAPGARRDRLKISFKLDPRLTQGLHMGERWVSPANYVGSQSGSLFTVQARAAGIDAEGRQFRSPTWLPAEPDMVAVSPDEGRQVEITVLRPGQSKLTVSEGGALRTLTVKAARQANVWRVDISQ
jgi:hypothetical protein